MCTCCICVIFFIFSRPFTQPHHLDLTLFLCTLRRVIILTDPTEVTEEENQAREESPAREERAAPREASHQERVAREGLPMDLTAAMDLTEAMVQESRAREARHQLREENKFH
jgi:hypothetical protein